MELRTHMLMQLQTYLLMELQTHMLMQLQTHMLMELQTHMLMQLQTHMLMEIHRHMLMEIDAHAHAEADAHEYALTMISMSTRLSSPCTGGAGEAHLAGYSEENQPEIVSSLPHARYRVAPAVSWTCSLMSVCSVVCRGRC